MAEDMAAPPTWMEKTFVEKALSSELQDPSIKLLSFEITSPNSAGDGYLSDMYLVTAKLSDSREHRMFVKCMPQEGPREDLIKVFDAFDKETRILTTTLPAMHSLLEKASAGKFRPMAAKCLYQCSDPIKYIVLEDLRESGFRMAKRQEGFDLAHCSLAIKTLARFHASSVALHEQDPSAIECFNESVYREESRQQIQPFVENAAKCLTEMVSSWPGYERYAQKLKDITGTMYDRLIQVCKRKDDEFNVLIHGDCWSNNMMFEYSGGVPEDIRLVDFQLCHYNSPALDLQHILHVCPRDDVREEHMDGLIQEYHTTLVNTLRDLGVTRCIISLQELKKNFSDRAFFGFCVSVSVLPIALSNPDDGFDFEKTMSESFDAVQGNSKIYANEVYTQTMKRLLPIFEQNGAF